MFDVVDIEFIRRKHFVKKWSIRKISDTFKIARQTVRKALKSAEPWEYTLQQPRACPVMDCHRETIVEWLEADHAAPAKQQHTAKRVYDRLVEECSFKGAESTVRPYVAKLRRELGEPNIEPFFVLTASPGEMAQIDWGEAKVVLNGVETVVHLFCLRMRASSVPFVCAFRFEKTEAFLEGHVRAFEWLDGVPEKTVYDNLTTAVRKVLVGHERDLQERFITLRSHYLFESVFCNRAAGHEKGGVENLVGYVRRNALVPVPHVNSVDELDAHLLAWCEKERSRCPEAWRLEHAGLRPLPKGIFRACTTRFLPVNKFSLVTYDRNRYSVPTEYIGENVRVDVYSERLEMSHGHKQIAGHARRLGRNQSSLKLEHYLSALARKPYAVTNAAVVRDLPEPYQTVRERLCRSDSSGYREMVRVLMLHREFSAETVREALTLNLSTGLLTADDVRQTILNRQRPKVTEGAVTVPRSVAEIVVQVGDPRRYDALLGRGA